MQKRKLYAFQRTCLFLVSGPHKKVAEENGVTHRCTTQYAYKSLQEQEANIKKPTRASIV